MDKPLGSIRENLEQFREAQSATRILQSKLGWVIGRLSTGEVVFSNAASLPADERILTELEILLGKLEALEGEGPFDLEIEFAEAFLETTIISVGPADSIFYAASKGFPEGVTVMSRFVRGKVPTKTNVATILLRRRKDAEDKAYVELLGFSPGHAAPLEPWLLKEPVNEAGRTYFNEAIRFWNEHARMVEDWSCVSGSETDQRPAMNV